MSVNKYRVREFTPTANQIGMSHSFSAQAVVDNIITNKELAKKIEARGLSRAAEIKGILEEAANIILEEIAENNRVQLESGEGVLVSIYPSCSGSISDAMVQANPEKYNNATKATADMLTPEMISWTVGASIGRKFAKQFALNKTAQKVDYNPSQQPAEPQESGENTGDNSGNSGSTNPTNPTDPGQEGME